MESTFFGIILLGAGASQRMGQPKLLLRWNDATILGHLWNLLTQLQPTRAVVVLAPVHPYEAELDRLQIPPGQRVINSAAAEGMFSSVRCGLGWPGWPAEITHFLVALGDQPMLTLSVLKNLQSAAALYPERIIQPVFRGQRGHPIILPRSVACAILEKNHFSLKEALAEHEPMLFCVESSEPGVLQDIDTPEEYQTLSPGNSAEKNA